MESFNIKKQLPIQFDYNICYHYISISLYKVITVCYLCSVNECLDRPAIYKSFNGPCQTDSVLYPGINRNIP